MHAQSSVWIMHECEPSLWMLLVAQKAWFSGPVRDQTLLEALKQLHAVSVLLHGPLQRLLDQVRNLETEDMTNQALALSHPVFMYRTDSDATSTLAPIVSLQLKNAVDLGGGKKTSAHVCGRTPAGGQLGGHFGECCCSGGTAWRAAAAACTRLCTIPSAPGRAFPGCRCPGTFSRVRCCTSLTRNCHRSDLCGGLLCQGGAQSASLAEEVSNQLTTPQGEWPENSIRDWICCVPEDLRAQKGVHCCRR